MKPLKNLETDTPKARYIVKLSEVSNHELEEIYDYIFWRLSSPINANNFREKIYSKLEILKNNPYIYQTLIDYSNLDYKYRKLPIDNYIILYTILE